MLKSVSSSGLKRFKEFFFDFLDFRDFLLPLHNRFKFDRRQVQQKTMNFCLLENGKRKRRTYNKITL
jgi:hypothetical protein